MSAVLCASIAKHHTQLHLSLYPDSCSRYEVVQYFMNAGLAFSAIDKLRPILTKPETPITNSCHMAREYVPLVHQAEMRKIKDEIQGQFLGVIFDGTSRMGEVVAIVARWCDESFVLHQRAVSAPTLKTHANGETLARLINTVMVKQYDVGDELTESTDTRAHIVGFTRDSAAVNGAAVRVLNVLHDLSVDVLCVSHTLDNVGEHIAFSNVTTFMAAWLQVAQSPRARDIWRYHATESMKTYSNTRWWSKCEVQNDIFARFSCLEPFVKDLQDTHTCVASIPILRSFINDENKFWLQLCLAACKDISTPLISATYSLEGDRLEFLLAFDRIQHLLALGDQLRVMKDKVALIQALDGAPPPATSGSQPASRIYVPLAEPLPSVAALIKEHATDPVVGTPVSKYFDGMGRYAGRVTKLVLRWNPPTNKDEVMYTVVYSDDDFEDLSKDDCMEHFAEFADRNYLKILDGLIPAFDYLARRFDGTGPAAFDCSASLEMFRYTWHVWPGSGLSRSIGFRPCFTAVPIDDLPLGLQTRAGL